MKNCRSVKSLQRSFSKNDLLVTPPGYSPDSVTHIPYILFCFESKMAEETLLNELNKNGNRDEMLQPDAIFILNRLSYINCRHYADGPKIDHVEHGEIQGWLMMKSNDSTLFELINFVHTYVPIPLLMTSPLKSYFSSIPPYETKFTKFTNSTG